jgi:hypothetical protein
LPPVSSKINDFGLKYCILAGNAKKEITGRSEGRAVLDSVNSHKSEISPILAEMLCISKLFKSLIFQVK